ncbi:adenylate/guanylate cyclase domain-containing protein [Desulfococcaceae bacterium HSG8]|nr:adenylate/guanylate cyclase domain-containing protein [Desulfococcaceae bacterium HSG8]
MSKKGRKISLGIKIFSLALSMLVLLIVVAYFSHERLSRANERVADLTRYLIPITDIINIVDVHVLEQEIHLEHIMRLYEIEPLDKEHLARESEQFEDRGTKVDEELLKAIQLARDAIQHAKETEDRGIFARSEPFMESGTKVDEELLKAIQHTNKTEGLEIFARLEPFMEQIGQKHRKFHAHALKVIELLETQKKEEAHRLEEQLETEEDRFDHEVKKLRLDLQQYTQEAAHITRQQQQQVLRLNLIMTILGTVLGILWAFLLTIGLVRPVGKLMNAMREVGHGNLDIQVDVISGDEIGFLADSFSSMVDELVLKEKIKGTFGKYVDPRVVESLINKPGGPETGGKKQFMTVLFADIEKFDTIAKKLTPEDLVHFINQYLTLMSEPISAHTGVLDKFIGTTVMAFWGLPFTTEADHARMACEAALDQLAQLGSIRRLAAGITRATEPVAALNLRIGITTGHLVVGNMGSEQSKSYTVLGDTVNTASRLKGACKQYGTHIMVTESTQAMIREVIETREIDLIQVIGKEEPVRVFELLGRKGELDQITCELRDNFEQGVSAYRSQAWDQALHYFEDCVKLNPDDTPGALFIERIRTLRENPPGDDWDGTWRLTKK